MPIRTTRAIESVPVTISSYTTIRKRFFFYFPREGTLTHYPSNVSVHGEVRARSDAHSLKVVTSRTLPAADAKNLNFDDLV